MTVLPLLQQEFDQESTISRKFFKLLPDDKLDWQPHERSMTLKALATHLAEIPGWPDMMVNQEELDFQADSYQPSNVETSSDLQHLFENNYDKGKAALENASEEDLDKRWVMRSGEQIYLDLSKYQALRHCLNQITHHRAQLGVYLRLLDIPIPGSYGPSADDSSF